jgi:hypothetical protein
MLFILGIQYQLVNGVNNIMTVTTRSKSRLLTQFSMGSSEVQSLSTSSSTEPLRALNLLTNSTFESSKVPSTSMILPLEVPNNIALSFLDLPSPAPNINIAPICISNATGDFQNSEFQKCVISNCNASFTPQCHNFENIASTIMESDCKDDGNAKAVLPMMMDITKLITSLSQQISNQSNFIQDQLLQQKSIIDHQATNDLKLQQVLQANENFKRDVKLELENLRNLIGTPSNTTQSSRPHPVKTNMPPDQSGNGTVVSGPGSNHLPIPPVMQSVPQVNSTTDSTQQVMLMLAESFSKLSTLMVQDKSSEPKYDWPIFAGDTKVFKAWYLAIIAQLSLPQ